MSEDTGERDAGREPRIDATMHPSDGDRKRDEWRRWKARLTDLEHRRDNGSYEESAALDEMGGAPGSNNI